MRINRLALLITPALLATASCSTDTGGGDSGSLPDEAYSLTLTVDGTSTTYGTYFQSADEPDAIYGGGASFLSTDKNTNSSNLNYNFSSNDPRSQFTIFDVIIGIPGALYGGDSFSNLSGVIFRIDMADGTSYQNTDDGWDYDSALGMYVQTIPDSELVTSVDSISFDVKSLEDNVDGTGWDQFNGSFSFGFTTNDGIHHTTSAALDMSGAIGIDVSITEPYIYNDGGTGSDGDTVSLGSCEIEDIWTGNLTGDYQASTFCQTACAYRSGGMITEADYTCTLLDDFNLKSTCKVC
jgi:hypothetical protein